LILLICLCKNIMPSKILLAIVLALSVRKGGGESFNKAQFAGADILTTQFFSISEMLMEISSWGFS
jgi:hypothetical protein